MQLDDQSSTPIDELSHTGIEEELYAVAARMDDLLERTQEETTDQV